jgi:hypothetical protein
MMLGLYVVRGLEVYFRAKKCARSLYNIIVTRSRLIPNS